MSLPTDDLEPLPDDVRALLDGERPVPPAPEGSRARIYARLATTLGLFAVPGGPEGAIPRASSAASGASGIVGKLVVSALVAAAGAGAWFALGAPATEPPAAAGPATLPPVVAAPPAPAIISPAAPPAPASAPARAAVAREPRRSAAPVAAAPGLPGQSDLAGERALLEDARAALAGGDARGALARVEQHAARFPKGQLVEEREAVAVRALAVAGDRPAARARADRFRARFPESIFLSAVEGAAR